MLRHAFVTTMLDAGVDLPRRPNRGPPRRSTHHDALRPRRKNLDCHPNYILAAHMASGT
jgi:hypothetical protein